MYPTHIWCTPRKQTIGSQHNLSGYPRGSLEAFSSKRSVIIKLFESMVLLLELTAFPHAYMERLSTKNLMGREYKAGINNSRQSID